MRIVSLHLRNWRGVKDRELEFEPGVTIVEGPNEIGKTSIVEAVGHLVGTLDSSKKREVKAIQPVGQDVGSRVEAEIEVGRYRFRYAKQFNRQTETVLEILAPEKRSQTGRPAHEEAEALLREAVDLDLWRALLVEQGKAVAQAELAGSRGLSKALDAAAGSSDAGVEDTALLEAVENEFLRYFTPGGQPRNRVSERYEAASAALESARQELERVEADASEHERQRAEVRRLVALVPKLADQLHEHRRHWERVRRVEEQLGETRRSLDDARQILADSRQAGEQREQLRREMEELEARIRELATSMAPLEERIEELNRQLESAREAVESARAERAQAAERLNAADRDREHLEDQASLKEQKRLLERCLAYAEEREEKTEVLEASVVDDEALERIREADSELRILAGSLQTAATHIRIEAESDGALTIGDEESRFAAGEQRQVEITAPTTIAFPGVARLAVTPPKSVADLRQELVEHQAGYEKLLAAYRVADYAAAVVSNDRRKRAERDIERLKDLQRETLPEGGIEALKGQVDRLQRRCAAHEESRSDERELPSDLEEARAQQQRGREAVRAADEALEARRGELVALESRLGDVRTELDDLERKKAVDEASLADRERILKGRRASESDEALARRVAEQERRVAELESAADELADTLAREAPEETKLKYENAEAAHERARSELTQANESLAVLRDRLDRARAGGRYEALEAAEREFEAAESAHREIERRAAAALKLRETLLAHREEVRKAYVAPLEAAIEKLGRIVFGPDCAVELSDDLSIVSRTLDGQRIPFEDLSIGAQEQLGIIARLAAGRIVADEEGVPIILDDALGFSDPTRLGSMGAAIADVGKSCQVILLTCTPERFANVGTARVIKMG